MFQATFDTDNAAFAEDLPGECARILRQIAEHIAQGYRDGKIYDVNGNRVGKWSLS